MIRSQLRTGRVVVHAYRGLALPVSCRAAARSGTVTLHVAGPRPLLGQRGGSVAVMLRILAVLAIWVTPALASARTIAIAYFDNNTGKAELDPLRKGLADM